LTSTVGYRGLITGFWKGVISLVGQGFSALTAVVYSPKNQAAVTVSRFGQGPNNTLAKYFFLRLNVYVVLIKFPVTSLVFRETAEKVWVLIFVLSHVNLPRLPKAGYCCLAKALICRSVVVLLLTPCLVAPSTIEFSPTGGTFIGWVVRLS
jgi:hypothetical protein